MGFHVCMMHSSHTNSDRKGMGLGNGYRGKSRKRNAAQGISYTPIPSKMHEE